MKPNCLKHLFLSLTFLLGIWSATVRLPGAVISSCWATAGQEGDSVTITGSGFGTDVDDLCLAVRDGNSGRLIPLQTLSVTDTQVVARLGSVPPGAQPGALLVSSGNGAAGWFQPEFSDVQVRDPSWVWHGPSPTGNGPIFEPRPAAAPSYATFFHSGPPSNGVLQVVLSGEWPRNAVVSVALSAHDATGLDGVALDAPGNVFTEEGTLLECAERVADIIRSAFDQQAGVAVNASVEEVPGVPAVQLTVDIPGELIDRGFLTVGRFDPLTVTAVDPVEADAGDRVLITGSGFGSDRDALMVYVDHGDTQTLLEVIAAMETRIIARISSVGPEAQPGPLVVAQALGRRFVPDIEPPEPPRGTAHKVIKRGAIAEWPIFDPRWAAGITGDECFQSTGSGHELELLTVPDYFPYNAIVNIQYSFKMCGGNLIKGIGTFTVPGGPNSAMSTAAAICNYFSQAEPAVGCSISPGPPVILTFSWPTCNGPSGGYVPWDGWVKVCYRYPTLVTTTDVPSAQLGDRLFISGTGFGSDPDHLKAHIEGANGVSTPLSVISASETQLVAQVNLLPVNAESGPVLVTRGLGGRDFPEIPGVTHKTGLWTWTPADGPASGNSNGTATVEISPSAVDHCFESTASDGVISLEVEGDWSSPTWVSITFGLDKQSGGDPLASNIGATSFYLAGGTSAAGVEAIRQMLDGMVLTGIGLTHVTTTQTGPTRYAFIISAKDFLGAFVPITGYVDLCYRACVEYRGTLHLAKGMAQIVQEAGANTLEVTTLSDGGGDGVVVELNTAQGWGAEFMPFALQEGQGLGATLMGGWADVTGLSLESTAVEWRDGETHVSSEWQYLGVERYQVIVENSIGERLEWGVFENNESFSVDDLFPDSCLGIPVQLEGLWMEPDEVWIRVAKPDCICPEADSCTELLVRMIPVDPPAMDGVVATAVELTMTAGPTGAPAVFTLTDEFLTDPTEPLAPVLRIQLLGDMVAVTWTGTGTLEETVSPNGPWQEVLPAPSANSHTEPVSGQSKFFRLRE